MTAQPVNHFQGTTFTFCSASLEADCCCELCAIGICEIVVWIWQSFKACKVSSTREGSKVNELRSCCRTGDVFIRFQNSTSWQSWHPSAHSCTSSWLTNAECDAPVASVKVVVSASCLRGKRPSASSKLLRYLESQPTSDFPYLVFSQHATNQTQE